MPRVLILFAHPSLEKSRVHAKLVKNVPDHPDITFHDLYEAYPDYNIDVDREQQLLIDHDIIVSQHPFFWYSIPPLLKQWIDLVLEHGWAYGSEGKALVGKSALSLISTGGGASAYTENGHNRFTIDQFLAPIEQTWVLCGVKFMPPYTIHGSLLMTTADIEEAARAYHNKLLSMATGQEDSR